MTSIVLPDWPTNPDMEAHMPVRSAILQQAIADHLHTSVTMHMRSDVRGLVLSMNASEVDVWEAAELYCDPVGIKWRRN